MGSMELRVRLRAIYIYSWKVRLQIKSESGVHNLQSNFVPFSPHQPRSTTWVTWVEETTAINNRINIINNIHNIHPIK